MQFKIHRKHNLVKLVFIGQFTTIESMHNYRRKNNPIAWFRDNLGPNCLKRIDGRELDDNWWTYKLDGQKLIIRMKDCSALTQFLLIHSD